MEPKCYKMCTRISLCSIIRNFSLTFCQAVIKSENEDTFAFSCLDVVTVLIYNFKKFVKIRYLRIITLCRRSLCCALSLIVLMLQSIKLQWHTLCYLTSPFMCRGLVSFWATCYTVVLGRSWNTGTSGAVCRVRKANEWKIK